MLKTKSQTAGSVSRFRRHQHLVRAGQDIDAFYHIEEGWAGRYTLLGGGQRQFTCLYMPGDVCEPHWLIRPRSTEAIVALSPIRARRLPIAEVVPDILQSQQVREICDGILNLIDRQSAMIAALGRKTAIERLCSILVEFLDRSNGAISTSRFAMPLTQVELADVVGLTPIHVNRVLKELRQRGVVDMQARQMMTVLDQETLRAIAAADGR